MFKPTDRFQVRLHTRADRYFLFFENEDGSLGELATKTRFLNDTDAQVYVGDRDGDMDKVDMKDTWMSVPAGFKLPRR